VVVPAYRNADTLPELVARIAAATDLVGELEILVVDDASPDQTRRVLTGLVAGEPRLAGLGLAHNVGQQRAIRTGLAHSRGQRIVVLDADLQDPPEAIPSLAQELADAPVVFAGRRGRYQAWPRRLTSRAFKLTQAWLAGVPSDASLFFALRREVASALVAYPARDPAIVPLLGALVDAPRSLPVARSVRPTGASAYRGSMRLRSGWRALRFALHLRRHPPGSLPPASSEQDEAVAYRQGWLEHELSTR
jgi:glycosyltransferase involved in cell wall biosynthesis